MFIKVYRNCAFIRLHIIIMAHIYYIIVLLVQAEAGWPLSPAAFQALKKFYRHIYILRVGVSTDEIHRCWENLGREVINICLAIL